MAKSIVMAVRSPCRGGPEEHPQRVAAATDFGLVRRLTARFSGRGGQRGVAPAAPFTPAPPGEAGRDYRRAAAGRGVPAALAVMWFLGYDLDERPADRSVLAWRRRLSSVRARLHYTAVALGTLGFTWFLAKWNLLGFRI